MTAAMAMPGNTAETFLVHFFGTGLADDRYVVERFKARADGDIVPAPAEALAAKGRRKVKRTTITLKAVKDRTAGPGPCRPLPCHRAAAVDAGRRCTRRQDTRRRLPRHRAQPRTSSAWREASGCSPTAGTTCTRATSTPARPRRRICGASASST